MLNLQSAQFIWDYWDSYGICRNRYSYHLSTHTGGILCASLVLSFVWSLRDVQQSPFLFCFSQFALCRLEMGNRSKAEWMSCFARSPSLNGFQGWVSLCMCCLAVCACVCAFVRVWMSERERESLSVCTCVSCMYMQMYVCVSEWFCACVSEHFPLCLCFYQTAECTLECLRITLHIM